MWCKAHPTALGSECQEGENSHVFSSSKLCGSKCTPDSWKGLDWTGHLRALPSKLHGGRLRRSVETMGHYSAQGIFSRHCTFESPVKFIAHAGATPAIPTQCIGIGLNVWDFKMLLSVITMLMSMLGITNLNVLFNYIIRYNCLTFPFNFCIITGI